VPTLNNHKEMQKIIVLNLNQSISLAKNMSNGK